MQKSGHVHGRRLRAIRPFVNFNYDLRKELTPAAKRKIKKYYELIERLSARPTKIYRPRNRENLRAAQDFAQHETKLPGLRVAFVPVGQRGVAKFKVRKTKSGVRFKVKERGIARESLPFNPRKLIRDTERHVAETLAQKPHATHFSIQAAEFEIHSALSRERVLPRVKELMERYSPGGERFRESKSGRSSNHWNQWMHGLNVYTFPDQVDPGLYMHNKKQSGKAMRKLRKKKRRAINRPR